MSVETCERMKVLETIEAMRDFLRIARQEEQSIGIVPTMGALHAGHLSLVEQALSQCDLVVTTIYVNPTQFAPQEDFAKYPRTLAVDAQQLADRGCHAVFAPSNEIMYPSNYSTSVTPPRVALELEGKFRPTHFAGVCSVVLKLFNIVQPTDAFFGLKDYQQFAVLRQMVADFDLPITMHGCETVREQGGLAMSSRNAYLSPQERQQALAINRALCCCQELYASGCDSVTQLESVLNDTLSEAGISDIQYAVVRDAQTLRPTETIAEQAIALIAARVGTTRLIDNRLLVRT